MTSVTTTHSFFTAGGQCLHAKHGLDEFQNASSERNMENSIEAVICSIFSLAH